MSETSKRVLGDRYFSEGVGTSMADAIELACDVEALEARLTASQDQAQAIAESVAGLQAECRAALARVAEAIPVLEMADAWFRASFPEPCEHGADCHCPRKMMAHVALGRLRAALTSDEKSGGPLCGKCGAPIGYCRDGCAREAERAGLANNGVGRVKATQERAERR